MRRLAISLGVLVVLCSAFAGAQQGPKKDTAKKDEPAKPLSLEEMLAKAVKDNPDIRVAETKVREAEAELNRVRLGVMQKVVKAHHEVAAHRAIVAEAEARLKRVALLGARAAISQEEVSAAQHVAQQAKANLAKAEAELPFLLGNQPILHESTIQLQGVLELSGSTFRVWDPATALKPPAAPVRGTMAENIRKLLDTPIKPEFDKVRLEHVLKYLRDRAKGVNIHLAVKADLDMPITVHFTEAVPFGALAQWFEDHMHWRFVVRDYGIVITDPNQLPGGAVFLHDFWKSDAGKTTSTPKK